MKIVKTYSLSEKSLEKDIDKFIINAKKGAYYYDYKYGQEGLKILKAYFRLIEAELKQQNFLIARNCYRKLLFFLLQTKCDYFNYEDLMSKFNSEKIVGDYFLSIIRTSAVEELFREFIEYLKIKSEYYFESAERTILLELSTEDQEKFIHLVENASEDVKEKEYALYDLIYFLLYLAKQEKDKKKYFQLCERFVAIVGQEEKDNFGIAE